MVAAHGLSYHSRWIIYLTKESCRKDKKQILKKSISFFFNDSVTISNLFTALSLSLSLCQQCIHQHQNYICWYMKDISHKPFFTMEVKVESLNEKSICSNIRQYSAILKICNTEIEQEAIKTLIQLKRKWVHGNQYDVMETSCKENEFLNEKSIGEERFILMKKIMMARGAYPQVLMKRLKTGASISSRRKIMKSQLRYIKYRCSIQ